MENASVGWNGPESAAATPGLHPIPKACDTCRRRKVRCDKKSPCANCVKNNVNCVTSPRVQRPRHSSIALSQYQQRIDSIDRRLERMGSLIDPRNADDSDTSTAEEPTPLPQTKQSRDPVHPTRHSQTYDAPRIYSPGSANLTPPSTRPSQDSHSASPSATPGTTPRTAGEADLEPEGSSSLSAHSKFAVEFFNKMTVSDVGTGSDTQELLGALAQIVEGLQNHQTSADMLFSLSDVPGQQTSEKWQLPPIEQAVAAIRIGQDRRCLVHGFFSMFTRLSMSDLCLKVYFSQDSTEAELIILNVALFFQFSRLETWESHRSLCAQNLTRALTGLPLYIKPDHDMVVALLFGAFFAIQNSKPFAAWPLITSAYQAACSLGFHTRQRGADPGAEFPNKSGMIFWIIFITEKVFSLRLGRPSTIATCDVTVPLPGGSHLAPESVMAYIRIMIRFAVVEAKIYQELYSAQALKLPDGPRREIAAKLCRETLVIQEDCYKSHEHHLRVRDDEEGRNMIQFVFAADKVQILSILTLVHRAVPPPMGSLTTFTPECIDSARAAVEARQEYAPISLSCNEASLSAFMNWGILITPFVCYVVLFCHVIESGNSDDLERMANFVQSMEPLQGSSNLIRNHYRLFHVLYSIGRRYTELRATVNAPQPEGVELKSAMDGYLSELGYQPELWTAMGNELSPGSMAVGEATSTEVCMDDASAFFDGEQDHSSGMANWLCLSQQMMGLLDKEDFVL